MGWPRKSSADLVRLHAPLAAALRPTGSAALTTCTVLPPLPTAPFVAKKAQLMKLAKSKQCGSGETSCPAGCCPEAIWFCCPDNMYCAATAADCPFRCQEGPAHEVGQEQAVRIWRDLMPSWMLPRGQLVLLP